MKQISFAQAEHQIKTKVTRHERFLAQMDALVPWQWLIEALTPSYSPHLAGKRGRSPSGLERMLRICFLQQWYTLTDEALENISYDSQAMRDFIGIDLAIETVPDATTQLRFRHLLKQHALTQRIFEEICGDLPRIFQYNCAWTNFRRLVHGDEQAGLALTGADFADIDDRVMLERLLLAFLVASLW